MKELSSLDIQKNIEDIKESEKVVFETDGWEQDAAKFGRPIDDILNAFAQKNVIDSEDSKYVTEIKDKFGRIWYKAGKHEVPESVGTIKWRTIYKSEAVDAEKGEKKKWVVSEGDGIGGFGIIKKVV